MPRWQARPPAAPAQRLHLRSAGPRPRRRAAGSPLALLLLSLLPAAPDARAAGAAPRLTRLAPPLGHVAGGTQVTITGVGFDAPPDGARVRFACENDVKDVPARRVSATSVVATTPAMRGACTAHVTVSNGGGRYSGAPLVFVAHSGSFLQFVFDDSDPGCPGCRGPRGKQATVPVAARVRERWEASVGAGPARGPFTGGTDVLVYARRYEGGNVDRFLEATQPTGGPGAPSVVPPRGQPLPTGTFYPGRNLQCLFTCHAPAAPFYGLYGLNFYGLPMAPSRAAEAFWIDYDRVRCVSPAVDPGFVDALPDVDDTNVLDCAITVTNNGGQTFDDAEDPETGLRLLNAARVSFTYVRRPPAITELIIDRGGGASAPQRDRGGFPARTPMRGGAELTVRGADFLPSPRVSCRFNDMAAPPVVVPALFDGPNQVRCLTPTRPELSVTAATAYDGLPPAPCFASEVTVSNDGVRFSRPAPGAFVLYCDVHVDPSGDDVSGRGTPDAPFGSIQRGIDEALRGPRRRPPNSADGVLAPSQPGDWVNADRVVVHDGVYMGSANTELKAGGRVVEVVARSARRDAVVVDCGGAANLLAPGLGAGMPSDAATALSSAPSLTPGALTLRGIVARGCGAGADGPLDVSPLGSGAPPPLPPAAALAPARARACAPESAPLPASLSAPPLPDVDYLDYL